MVAELKQAVKDAVIEALRELAVQVWGEVKIFLIDASFNLALVGGGILIVLYVAGYKKGMRYTGILVVSHVLIRALLG